MTAKLSGLTLVTAALLLGTPLAYAGDAKIDSPTCDKGKTAACGNVAASRGAEAKACDKVKACDKADKQACAEAKVCDKGEKAACGKQAKPAPACCGAKACGH